MPKIWKVKTKIPDDIAQNLSEYPELLRQLFFNRGLTGKDQIQDFLEPKYENLYSPFLFKDMEKAVERIWQAIDRSEKICIYGDYDADAITANAVLAQTFKYLGVEILSYIPDRFTEGYGINIDALLKIKDEGSKIIITVDCGTNSADAAEFCKKNNIDLIITDHHEIIGEVPDAYALINPKNPDDNYLYRDITGVGVAFKLACGILSKREKIIARFEPSPLAPLPKGEGKPGVVGWEKWLLDLVAIGTVADCHSLLGENRILVKYGLKVLAKTKWIGLRALMESAGLAEVSPLQQRGHLCPLKPLDTYTLGFIIAPRLNAAGRLEHAGIALDLLLETDANRANEKARKLEAINTRRQGLTAEVLSEAKEKVLLLKERKVLALVGEGWPKGVMGLVAGKLAEEFYKPTIVLEKTENLCTGSARTAGKFDILEALKFSSEHLSKFGGHKQAAGLSLEANKFDLFYQKLLEYAEVKIAPESAQKALELEAKLEGHDLIPNTYNLISKLQPFGVDNPTPKFLVSNLEVSSIRMVGKQTQHLQVRFILPFRRHSDPERSEGEESQSKGEILRSAQDDAGVSGREIAGIMFNAPDFAKTLKIGDTVDVAAELIEDGWNGKREVKLRIVDLKII